MSHKPDYPPIQAGLLGCVLGDEGLRLPVLLLHLLHVEEDADERRLVFGLGALGDESVVPFPCPDAVDLAPGMCGCV